ncbi:MAG: 3-phosphoshikimate 1-carboxyvinyltransferase [Rhodospirillales bacterium]|nr:3-phosphoshikimate 1-carboxyvinyltransferase [Rhodospirillales bacterium]MBO6787874.1 3-phosphoshikimate 1-carboxyvinyltransferase [Rhodospirillales bacterium]
MPALRAIPVSGLQGRINVPGDKSVSHRALMLSALAIGETRISGLLEGEDVLATAEAMRSMGANVSKDDDGVWTVAGVGVGALAEPAAVIDMGNAGTGVRLLMGLVATHPITCTFTGDASLSRRPMERVMGPLRRFGTQFTAREGGLLPITVIGAADPVPVRAEMTVPSAQVKSAVLLAGLNAPGETVVIEKEATRDHTENMLRHFGADVVTEPWPSGGVQITLTGQPVLTATDIHVPADISSAAFPIVAALITPGSDVTIEAVGLNPLRAGLIETLRDMGAALTVENERVEGGEPVGDIRVKAGALKGIDVPPERAPSMIDEYPVLSVCAAFAAGTTRMTGLAELRVKESDRLAAMVDGLTACGVTVRFGEDWMEVDGLGGAPEGGATIAVDLDHRIAMSFLVLGCAAKKPVAIDDAAAIATSFPGFAELMNGLGARIEEVDA